MFRLSNRYRLTCLCTVNDLIDGFSRRARGSEQVERLHRQVQIRNRFGFGQLSDAHEIQCGAVAPSEFALEPRQPVAMTDELLALGQMAADLDDVLDGFLTKLADRGGGFGPGLVGDGG